MTNYLQLGQGLIKYFSEAEGCTTKMKLGKKGLSALAKKNPELGKIITEFAEDAQNPILEIAQKAKSNYCIASFRIKNGDTTLGKGAYSASQGANGIVEKVHVEADGLITNIVKENGKTKMDVIDSDMLPNVADNIRPNVYEITHQERVNSFFNRQSDVIKGLDSKNLWIKQDLLNIDPADFELLEKALDEAAKKGVKIPYGREFEYIEVPLTMADGRKHFVKIFPNFYEGKLKMRMYMDNDIPKDIYKTYHDVGVLAGDKQHPGIPFEIELKDFSKQARNSLESLLSSKDANTRIRARLLLGDSIEKSWTQDYAEEFLRDYELYTCSFKKRLGELCSPLKPKS